MTVTHLFSEPIRLVAWNHYPHPIEKDPTEITGTIVAFLSGKIKFIFYARCYRTWSRFRARAKTGAWSHNFSEYQFSCYVIAAMLENTSLSFESLGIHCKPSNVVFTLEHLPRSKFTEVKLLNLGTFVQCLY